MELEYTKVYAAFKAETNFEDVIARVNRLVFWLNAPYDYINNPKGITKDATGTNHNGNVYISISKSEDIPYAIGLVRQSFDYQMSEQF